MHLFISPVCLVAAVHNAWLREGHLSRSELHHSLSTYPPLYSSSPLKYFYFASPLHLNAVRTLCSEPHGRDRPHFVFKSRSHLPQRSFPPSLLCPFVLLASLASTKILDEEKTGSEDLKPFTSHKGQWDKHVKAFRRLIFAPPPTVLNMEYLVLTISWHGHSSHFTQISR